MEGGVHLGGVDAVVGRGGGGWGGGQGGGGGHALRVRHLCHKICYNLL